MSKRDYNVFFNTHTVSGIVISVGLYIIFFAGSFSFFREEIQFWQAGEFVNHAPITQTDCDQLLKDLDEQYELHGRDIDLRFQHNKNYIGISLSPSKDTLATETGKASHYFTMDVRDRSTKTYTQGYGLGEFLYRLHFLDPITYPIGRYLAGFIALFFVFAIVTGTIVHWKKIVPNFYDFNPKASLKRVWSDAHTALGVIGLPFQFMYGVTGAFFILSILVLIPANVLYKGNQEKLMEDLRPRLKNYEWQGKSAVEALSLDYFVQKASGYWEDFELTYGASIKNYGGTNMKYVFNGELENQSRFVGMGRLVFDAYTGELEAVKDPNKINYVEDLQRVLGHLHFGDFGGVPIRTIYFIMGMLTCFVIITGVLIWIEARNKKTMTLKQRMYTAKVGHIYMAICLSMLPVTALAFIFARITHGMFDQPQSAFYWFYFVVWGLFAVFFRFKRDNYFTNKMTLLTGGILGLLIPIVNGVTSGNWLWRTYAHHQYEILMIDAFWIIVSVIALLFHFNIKPSVRKQSTFIKLPID